MAVDGGSGTSRGHGPVMRRPGSRWSGAVSRPSAHDVWHLRALVLVTTLGPSTGPATAPCPAQTPPPNPTAAEPGDGRVLSRPSSRVHEPGTLTEAVALRSQTVLTGSGSHRSSYGGFGGGHPHFHPHAPDLLIRRYPRGRPDPFRSVRDLGHAASRCPGESRAPEGCSSVWLPAWLPACDLPIRRRGPCHRPGPRHRTPSAIDGRWHHPRALSVKITDTGRVRTSQPKAAADAVFRTLPLPQRAAQIRYGVNWQWTAIKIQYERLMARKPMQPGDQVGEAALEHMRGVVDMDFLVTAVRRLLRVAEQARRSGCDTNADLRLPMRLFSSRWSHVIDVRNTLEHVDSSGLPIVPMQSSSPDGRWLFLTPGSNLNVQDLFEDTVKLCRAIYRVIEPYEP